MVIGTLSILSLFIPVPSESRSHILGPSTLPLRRNIVPPSAPSDECLNPPQGSCTFYADCLESRYHCGPTGYPLGYGQKYCTKFLAERERLDSPGQTWMLATLHCLQVALVPDFVPDATGSPNATATCQALEDKAFGTHAGCYVSNGVCKLPLSDWEAILDIVGIETLVDSWDAFKATLTAGTECLDFIAFLIARGLRL
ncbi:hypothetical protein C8F04DRAFT_1106401 [Mycena alexandri]|uniref:Chitin-binding type-2 domain-containing protein n=1 Tax=Mycena alexandri TaxID=1745969 RepID=A0AAD6SSC3_9AGAR|nr:hypothetical protein C8F04DRAFT_1106401 [Mycena alexandri]